MVSSEVYHLLEDSGELGADCIVDLRQQMALHTGEDTVPGHTGHHVNVDWMLPNSWLRQTQYLSLSRARAVAHVHEHLLGAKQGRLHAVLVETRVLADVPKLLPKYIFLHQTNVNQLIHLHGWLIRLAAYCSMARKAWAALTRLKSGFHLAELEMMSPVAAETNLRCWGTIDR